MVVVQDEDYTDAIKRLESAGFHRSAPDRAPPPQILESLPKPQQVLEEINAGYKRLDQSCTVFDYPAGNPSERSLQLYLFLDSFAHLFPNNSGSLTGTSDAAPKDRFETYDNLHYPLEQALVESIAKAAIDEETTTGCSDGPSH